MAESSGANPQSEGVPTPQVDLKSEGLAVPPGQAMHTQYDAEGKIKNVNTDSPSFQTEKPATSATENATPAIPPKPELPSRTSMINKVFSAFKKRS